MSSTLRSSAKVGSAIFLSRILGVLRDSIFARLFGAGALTDAYNVAFRIPNLLRDLFAEGALSSAFVPTFSEALEKGGKERAYRLGNLVLGLILLVTGVLCCIGVMYAGGIVSLIAWDFQGDGNKAAMALTLTRIMMPLLLLVSASAVWMGMLNAQSRYTAPALAPAMFNVTSIACGAILLFLSVSDFAAMVIWSAGTAFSGFIQAVVQLPSLHRLGYRVRPTLRGLWADPGLRRILRLMAPATFGLAAIQINVFINTGFASSLGDGPLTYLQNAFRLFYLPVGLFGVALATVTTARASHGAAQGDRNAVLDRIQEGIQGVWLLALPSAVGLMVLARPVVELIFEGGRFLPSDTQATVPIVQAYMLGVLPYSLAKVFAPGFFTVDRPRIPMVASLSAVLANVVFSWLTYRQLGAKGLALGTTFGALINLAILRFSVARHLGPMRTEGRLRDRIFIVLACGLLAGTCTGLWTYVLSPARRLALQLPWGVPRLIHGIFLFATIFIGYIVYVSFLRLLRVEGSTELWMLPRRIVGRIFGGRSKQKPA